MSPSATVSLTELLSEEHRLIQRGVVVLARLCAHWRSGGNAEHSAAAALLRFIRQYADDHHHAKEEKILFPWMISGGFPEHGGPIPVMLHEHTVARSYVAAMAEAAERLVAADDEGARQRFVDNGEAYATLLWQHIWKEDNILYPMAAQLGGTDGLYDPAADSERDTVAVEAEFRGLIEGLERQAAEWPEEDIQWPQGCH